MGELLTASKLNTDVRDGLNFLLSGKPLAVLARVSAQTANPSVTMSWNSEIIDRDGGHDNSTNPSRYTAQTAGWYNITAALDWTNTPGTSYRKLTLMRSGIVQYQESRASVGFPDQTQNGIAVPLFLSVADYVEVGAYQDSGSGLSVTGRFTAEWTSTA